MAETLEQNADASGSKAPKDKNCPYCGQAFTSSSLGRHLDLYIKEKNPKPPDGLHDVDEIRKLRGNITRRQARASLARRDTSTPAGTPTATSKRSPPSDAESSSNVLSPVRQKDTQNPADLTANLYPFTPRWEATGVINDIPPKSGEAPKARDGDTGQDSARRPLPPKVVNRQMVKAQFDMKQKIQDAVDTARAAELALREMISSWRAAKQHIDMNSMPFDFDPLSLDFPALTLHCLQPPPTLYSSTQHSTSTSWSISPPGAMQHMALELFFDEEFRKWKIKCAAATTAIQEELTYPPSASVSLDAKDAVRRAEKTAESLERQVSEHLQTAFVVWENLSLQRRNELWMLELARSVGKRQGEVTRLKETQHSLKQENANLRSQIEHLNRLQQPREFKLFSPTTLPINENMVMFMQEEGITRGRRGIGLNMDDRHHDINTVVTSAIERWKSVIVSARSASGLNAQRTLDQAPLSNSAPSSAASTTHAASPAATGQFPGSQQLQQPPVPALRQPPLSRQQSTTSSIATGAPASATTSAAEPGPSAAPTPVAPSLDDDMSDQDADAEMEEDDGFAQMHTPITNPPPPAIPQQQTPQLEVSRTRGPVRRTAASGAKGNVGINGNRSSTFGGHPGGVPINMSRSMSNMNAARQGRNHGAEAKSGVGAMMGVHHAAHPDMAMAMQEVKGDPMYMD